MKKIRLTIFFVLAFLFGHAQTKNFIDQPYIEVSGTADSLVVPNQIFIKIIISEKDTKDRVSLEVSEIKMVSALKALGINVDTDLTTSDMLSNYRFYLLKQKEVLKSKQYILKVTEASTASMVFIKLEDLGISNTSIDRVNHTEIENIKNICRTKAIENAKAKAIALTIPLNQSIGSAIFITDNEINLETQLQGRAAGLMIRGYNSFESGKYESPKIEFEKIKVQQTVSAKFVLNKNN